MQGITRQRTAAGLTDDIPLHQVETVQFAHRLLRIVRAFVHDISRSFCLEIRSVGSYPYLADRAVLSEQVVEVIPGDIEVATVSWRMDVGVFKLTDSLR